MELVIKMKDQFSTQYSFYPQTAGLISLKCQTMPCLTLDSGSVEIPGFFWEIQSPVTTVEVNGLLEYFNPFNASCFKLLLFEGFSTILV